LGALAAEFFPPRMMLGAPEEKLDKLAQLLKGMTKEELKAYGELIRHPIRSFEEHPVYSGMRLLPPLGVAGALGRLGVGAKIAKGVAKIPKVGPKLERAFLRPHALEPKLQTLFRRHRGEVGLGRLGAREAAESLYKGLSSGERLRLGQIMKGGITTKPGVRKLIEPVKKLREELAGGLRERGLLGEETFLTKLPKKRVTHLKQMERGFKERLSALKEIQNTPVANRTKLFSELRKLTVWKEKYKTQMRNLRGQQRYKDMDLDINMTQLAIDGLNDEIKFVQQMIKQKRPYKGLAGDIKKLEKQAGDVDTRLYQHYHYGGWMEYMPREYLKHIENKATVLQFLNPKKYRIKTPWQKGRKDIPEEVRMAMGEVLEPSYPMYNAISKESRAIATYDLFQDLAKNPKWVWDGKGIKPEGWIRVSKTENLKSLGDLSGKWVRPDIAESVNRMSKVMGKGEAFYTKALSLWKWGKVVPRMGTHMRNIYNNLIFADFAGLSPFDPGTYVWLKRAMAEYRKRGTAYTELVKEGMLGTEFYGVEILPQFAKYLKSGKKANLFDSMTDVCKGGLNKLGEIYQAEDQIFKLAIYMKHRAKGRSMAEAVAQVDMWMPNYAEVPGATRILRQTAVPFFSFKSEAIRIAKNAAQDHPVKLAFWMMMPGMITDMSAKQMGLTDKQMAKLEAGRPEYARNGMYALVPSDKKDPRWMDLTYVMFLGDLTETADPRTFMANPVFTTGYAVATKVAGLQARELFSGRKITRPGMTFTEEVTAWLDYSAKQFGPSAPLPGSYDYDKLRRAFLKKPHPRTGKVPSKTWTALDVFGV